MTTLFIILGIIAAVILIPYLLGLLVVLIGTGEIDFSDEFFNFWFAGLVVGIIIVALAIIISFTIYACMGDIAGYKEAVRSLFNL